MAYNENISNAMANQQGKQPFRIIVVCGAPHVGKSTLIASLFDAIVGENIIDVIDMKQFQGQFPRSVIGDDVVSTSVSNALVDACVINGLIDAANLNADKLSGSYFVIEGTYLKSARRAPLMQSIKTGLLMGGYDDIDVDTEIIGIQVNGSDEMLSRYCPLTREQISVIDKMTLDEGFDSLICVTNAPEDGERYIKISGKYRDFRVTDYHEPSDKAKDFIKSCDYDRIMRDDLLGYAALMDSNENSD